MLKIRIPVPCGDAGVEFGNIRAVGVGFGLVVVWRDSHVEDVNLSVETDHRDTAMRKVGVRPLRRTNCGTRHSGGLGVQQAGMAVACPPGIWGPALAYRSLRTIGLRTLI